MKFRFNVSQLWLLGLCLSLISTVAYSATTGTLPTAYDGASGAAASGNFFTLITSYLDEGTDLIGWGLTIVAFFGGSYFTFTKFNDYRRGKAEMGEVGSTAAIAAFIVILVGYFANQAANVIGGTG